MVISVVLEKAIAERLEGANLTDVKDRLVRTIHENEYYINATCNKIYTAANHYFRHRQKGIDRVNNLVKKSL